MSPSGSPGLFPTLGPFVRTHGGRLLGRLAQSWQTLLLWSCGAFIAALFLAHVTATVKSPYINNFSNPEEWAYTNISAANYLKYGFRNSYFLQDHSTSDDPLDHPYVYNHMPPGPDIATALVLSVTGNNHALTRFIFALLLLPGIYYLVRFTGLVLRRIDLQGAPFVLPLAGAHFFIGQTEAQIHSIYLFLTFAPLVWAIEGQQRGSRGGMFAAWIALFFLSVYVQYILVAGTVFAWVFLYALRLFPITLRMLLVALSAVCAGVLAHLLQNLAFLGFENFYRELAYTIGNRTIGSPTQEEVAAFYESLGLVHHGARPPRVGTLLPTIVGNLTFRFLPLVTICALTLFLASRLATKAAGREPAAPDTRAPASAPELGYVLRLFAWAAATSLAVIVLFPAFTQEVNLRGYGMNSLLFAIPTLALLALAARHAISSIRARAEVLNLLPLAGMVFVVLLGYVVQRALGDFAALQLAVAGVVAILLLNVEPAGAPSRNIAASSAFPVETAALGLLLLAGWASLQAGVLRPPVVVSASGFVASLVAVVLLDRAAGSMSRGAGAQHRQWVLGVAVLLFLLLLPWLAIRHTLGVVRILGPVDLFVFLLCLAAIAAVALTVLRPSVLDAASDKGTALDAFASDRPRIGRVARALHVVLVAWLAVYAVATAIVVVGFRGHSIHMLLQFVISAGVIALCVNQTRQPAWLPHFLQQLSRNPLESLAGALLITLALVAFPVAGLFVATRGPGHAQFALVFVYIAFLSCAGLLAAIAPSAVTREFGALLERLKISWTRTDIVNNARPILGVVAGLVALALAAQAARQGLLELGEVWRSATKESEYADAEGLRKFRSELFMTNINVPVIAFFAESPGFGVCELRSIDETGKIDTTGCKISFMKRKEYWRTQQPRYFFFSAKASLFPGFADCLPERYFSYQRGDTDCIETLRRRLAENYALEHRDRLFEVYDLHRKLR